MFGALLAALGVPAFAEPAFGEPSAPAPGEVVTAEAHTNSAGMVEVRVPLAEHVSSMRLRLPEMRCPAGSPFVENERFDLDGERPVMFPVGLEPREGADFTVRATWTAHLANDDGIATSLQGGSVLELEGVDGANEAATFVLHCTSDPRGAATLGPVAKPSPIEIGAAMRHELRLNPEVRATIVEGGLPPGITLGERGDLSGTVLPTRSGSFGVTIRLTDGSTSIDHRLAVLVSGGRVIQHVTKTTQLPNRVDVAIADQGCPMYFPWTVSQQFHDPIWSAQKVPNGVQAVTHPGIVEVTSNPVVDNEGFTRGLMHIKANYRALSGTGAVHFVLHCTNDANAAGRR